MDHEKNTTEQFALIKSFLKLLHKAQPDNDQFFILIEDAFKQTITDSLKGPNGPLPNLPAWVLYFAFKNHWCVEIDALTPDDENFGRHLIIMNKMCITPEERKLLGWW